MKNKKNNKKCKNNTVKNVAKNVGIGLLGAVVGGYAVIKAAHGLFGQNLQDQAWSLIKNKSNKQ